MGIITDLLRQHSDKQLKDKTTALDGYRTLLTLPDQVLPPETKNWALDNILNLSGDVTGGGKGGKKGGGGGGKDQSANPFRSILAAMSGLNPVPATPKSVGQRPDQLLRSPADQQKYQQDQARQSGEQKAGEYAAQTPSVVDRERQLAPLKAEEKPQPKPPAPPKPTPLQALTGAYEASGMPHDEALKKAGAVLAREAETKSEPKPKPASAREKMADNIIAAGVETDPKKADAMAGKLLYDQAMERVNAARRSGGAGAAAMDPAAMRAIAEGVIKYKLPAPPFGMSANSPLRAQYLKAYGDVMRETGAGEAASERASFGADTQSLQQLVKNQATVKAMENGTNTEIDRAIALSKAVPRSQAHLLNGLLQRGEKELTDYPQLARFREAVLAARNRYASMISTARGGGGAVTNAARQEADEVINAAMAQGSFGGAAQEMKVGIQNVMKGLEDEIKTKRGEMIRQNGGGSTAGGQSPPPSGGPVQKWEKGPDGVPRPVN